MLVRIARGFVYANIWVGLSVASLSALSFVSFDYWSRDYILLSLFSTIAFYGYARWAELKETDLTPEQHIAAWTANNKRLLLFITIVTAALAGAFWFDLPTWPKWLFVGASALSSLYTVPAVFNKKGVRYLAGFKLIHIAGVWTIVTLTIPAVMANQEISTNLILHHLERFAFIIAITIPFDIRDARTDSTDLLTLPMWLGVNGARNLALSAIAFVILLQLYPGYNVQGIPWSEIIIYLLGGYLIHRSDEDLPDMYFSFLIEGLPILLILGMLFFY